MRGLKAGLVGLIGILISLPASAETRITVGLDEQPDIGRHIGSRTYLTCDGERFVLAWGMDKGIVGYRTDSEGAYTPNYKGTAFPWFFRERDSDMTYLNENPFEDKTFDFKVKGKFDLCKYWKEINSQTIR